MRRRRRIDAEPSDFATDICQGHCETTAVEWYRTFGKVFLESVPVADRAAFLDDYRTACAQRLGGENRLDFVRLRWRAVRRDDRSR